MKSLELFDLLFAMRLEQWCLMRRNLVRLFSQHEIDTMERTERTSRAGGRVVVFLAFENRFASLGGLTPVMKYLPHQLKKMGERVLFVSPFHAKHPAMKEASRAGLFTRCFSKVKFHLCGFEASCTCYSDTSAEIPSYYIQIPERFVAGENPYAYADQESLLLDTLAFAAAVPFALGKLGIIDNILFHAHEWEAAPIAITSKMAVMSAVLRHARTILTLHNSFDCAFPPALQKRFFGTELQGDTVLQCSIPFLNGPLVTVSTPFARELRHDPLQRTVFTDHLQAVFSMNPPLGIENGIFGETAKPFTDATLAAAAAGKHQKLHDRKNTFKRRFLKALKRTRDPRIIGKIAGGITDSSVPVFFMAGRLDFMQKGFDVMFCAFERLPRGRAKLFFCPSSMSGAPEENLNFFESVTARCKGDIEIWPFKIPRRMYNLFLRGSSFLLMPSLYEPFGSANEALLNGTPIVARGTGGLWLQVNPAGPVQVPTFYSDLNLDDKAHEFPTGILFREEYPANLAEQEWRRLLELSPEARMEVPLFDALVTAAHGALERAVALYARPHEYTGLVRNGIREVKKFTWERAAHKYSQVYDVAMSRGI